MEKKSRLLNCMQVGRVMISMNRNRLAEDAGLEKLEEILRVCLGEL